GDEGTEGLLVNSCVPVYAWLTRLQTKGRSSPWWKRSVPLITSSPSLELKPTSHAAPKTALPPSVPAQVRKSCAASGQTSSTRPSISPRCLAGETVSRAEAHAPPRECVGRSPR